MKKEQLKLNERERIIKIYNKGFTLKNISFMYDINISTTKRIINKSKSVIPLDRKEGTGIKMKYDINIIEKYLSLIIIDKRGISLIELKHILENEYQIKYSKSSLANILKKLNYTKKVSTLKLPLTDNDLNNRQYWCFFYNNYDNWDSVIWSDETKICNDHEKQKIWIRDNENVIKYKYKYPLKINIWGAILKNHKIIFEIFDKTLNSDKYVDILNNFILPLHNTNKKLIYQQDNAPSHTSIKSIKFFSENKIEVMYWPPRSPDLNPIENLWNLIKQETRKKYYGTKEEMIREITNILNNFPIEKINNLINSMDSRIDMLFNNNFDEINY